MFQRAFRDPAGAAPASLEMYLRELLLGRPWHDSEAASRVFVGADRRVRGFIGVLPMRMSFHGRHGAPPHSVSAKKSRISM